MPLRWSEVNNQLNADSYNIKNAVLRVKHWKKDPALDVLDIEVDLLAVLERLTEIFSETL
jgi:DNA primase